MTDGLPVERLREYLRELQPAARALLMRELERGNLGGSAVPGADLILAALRPSLRHAAPPPERIGNPARLFYRPLEPFLVDAEPALELPGRVARAALGPLWEWICRDLAPAAARAYSEQATAALLADDSAAAEALAESFEDTAAAAIGELRAAADRDERVRRRLVGQLGLPHGLADLQVLHVALRHRQALARLAAKLPAAITNLGDDQTANILALVRQAMASEPELLLPVLVLVMNRLGASWQMLRLAVRAAESDVAARVMQAPLAPAVTLVFADIRLRVEAVRQTLRRGLFAEAAGLCRGLHDAIRGLRTEMDLSGDSAWSRELAALRAAVSAPLKAEIEATPGAVRRLLRQRPAGAALDPADVAEAEARIALACAGRNYAGELAINQVAPRVVSELQAYFDTSMPALLEALRTAQPGERAIRQAQVEAAVRLAGKLFGGEYAGLLSRAAGMAAPEPRPAKA